MDESILTSVKKALGPEEDYEHFDPEIIMYINSVLATLTELGVGPVEGFMIQDKGAKWNDFISDDKLLNLVPTYVYLKVKLIFDPPTSSAVLESIKAMIAELEWRLNVTVDPGKVGEEDGT